VSITFKTDPAGRPVTESGRPVVCDGCGVRLTSQPRPEQVQQVPPAIARQVYGENREQTVAEGGQPLVYVVCDRGVDCLTLALLADDLYRRTRCRDPLCTGDGTLAHPCRQGPPLPADPYGPL
jgi:hypothetical protein